MFLKENICCSYSLEVPQWGTSNEYPQHKFLWRNKKHINTLLLKKKKCFIWRYSCILKTKTHTLENWCIWVSFSCLKHVFSVPLGNLYTFLQGRSSFEKKFVRVGVLQLSQHCCIWADQLTWSHFSWTGLVLFNSCQPVLVHILLPIAGLESAEVEEWP